MVWSAMEPLMLAVAVAGRSVRWAICTPLRYSVSVPPCRVSTQYTQVLRFDAELFGCSTYSVALRVTPA